MSSGKESMEAMMSSLNSCEEYQKMLRGELYYSFGPEMSAARRRCALACKKFNRAAEEEDITRREQVQLWRKWVSTDASALEILLTKVSPASWATPNHCRHKQQRQKRMKRSSSMNHTWKLPCASTMASISLWDLAQ